MIAKKVLSAEPLIGESISNSGGYLKKKKKKKEKENKGKETLFQRKYFWQKKIQTKDRTFNDIDFIVNSSTNEEKGPDQWKTTLFLIFPVRQRSFQRNPARTGSGATPFFAFSYFRSASIRLEHWFSISHRPTDRSIDSSRFLSIVSFCHKPLIASFFLFCSQDLFSLLTYSFSLSFCFRDDPCSRRDFASLSTRAALANDNHVYRWSNATLIHGRENNYKGLSEKGFSLAYFFKSNNL